MSLNTFLGVYAGYIQIFDQVKLSNSQKNENLDQPLPLSSLAFPCC